MLSLIVQKKGFDALNATQKTSGLCKVPFVTIFGKTGKNGIKGETGLSGKDCAIELPELQKLLNAKGQRNDLLGKFDHGYEI